MSLLYHDGEEVVRLQNIMLPDVDREIRERKLGKKAVLYRVDHLCGGNPVREMGKLKAGDGTADFLERVEADSGGDAGTGMLYILLKKHMALCRLEELARRGLSPQGQDGEGAGAGSAADGPYRQADAAYYREVLAYAGEARRILNRQPCPVLPPFPERSPFLAAWYGEHKDGGGRK